MSYKYFTINERNKLEVLLKENYKKLKNNHLPLLIKLKKYSIIMRLKMLVNTFRLLLNTYLGFELK